MVKQTFIIPPGFVENFVFVAVCKNTYELTAVQLLHALLDAQWCFSSVDV